MPFDGLTAFIDALEKEGELHRIKQFVDPRLEIAEITDRVTKSGGKALLFENTGTQFPVLINAFGSDKRISMVLGVDDLSAAGRDIEKLFNLVSRTRSSFIEKISFLPELVKMFGFMPSMTRRKGICQQVIHSAPDLGILPVLKCWPHDGGCFVTLPMVHTIHPLTGNSNVGMYRMQILDGVSTGMHWQRHKTGANHYEAWKSKGGLMPVTVTLGGDPVYAYSATAPLPENISEYILAGFLRKKKVKLVKCITNDLYVPCDVDIVIEGYVDTAEEHVYEGPFGDHTGFYSLADYYPRFHVTCITHSEKAVYPATVVGVPPHEDAWLAKATERIFLTPIKMAVQPEIEDFNIPEAGVAHNLVIVSITKKYPGQGLKVINSLFGAGQMMFTKYLIVVSGDADLKDYKMLLKHITENISVESDIVFLKGPLDVLDHSSDNFSFGGKAGIDATEKFKEENGGRREKSLFPAGATFTEIAGRMKVPFISDFNIRLPEEGIPVMILSVNLSDDPESIEKVLNLFRSYDKCGFLRLVLIVDHTVDVNDYYMVVWQVLGNSDPMRDHHIISPGTLVLDGTVKFYGKRKFPRRWPNVVCADTGTIESINRKWGSLGFDKFIPSPSLKYKRLVRNGKDEIEGPSPVTPE